MFFPDKKSYDWLEKHAANIVRRCLRRVPSVPGFSEKPVTIYVPGGDDKYPSFWIRDAVMQCRSGCIPPGEMETMLKIILSFQNGPESRALAHHLRVTPWAIPDHINLPGLGIEEFQRTHSAGAVFYPGSYSTSDDQGDGHFGVRPADDDIYEVVQLAFLLTSLPDTRRSVELLRSPVNGVPVLERLHLGFQSMPVDRETGLHWNTPLDWAASSFHDALRPMGAVALTSCLRFRAAGQMAELFRLTGEREQEEEYMHLMEKLSEVFCRTFQRDDGWLIFATMVNRQPDTWTTAMAVYYGLLQDDYAAAASRALTKACRDGALSISGYLRHTPVWADDVPGRIVWEDGRLDENKFYGKYQWGGYWPQPLGYVCWSISQTDRPYAVSLAREFIEHTRHFEEDGAPFEWINPAVLKEVPGEGKWYGPSASLPLEGFRRLSQE